MFHIFNSVFWVQFYSPGASIIMGLHYYHIMLDFCKMNSAFEVFFQKVFFLFSVSGKVFFLGRLEIPNSADPCLYCFSSPLPGETEVQSPGCTGG